MMKGVDERIDEGVLQCFQPCEEFAKKVYVGECAGCRI